MRERSQGVDRCPSCRSSARHRISGTGDSDTLCDDRWHDTPAPGTVPIESIGVRISVEDTVPGVPTEPIDSLGALNDALAAAKAAGWERPPAPVIAGGTFNGKPVVATGRPPRVIEPAAFRIMGWEFRPHVPTGTFFTDAWRDAGLRRLRIAITDRLAREQMAKLR
jgi:hypothetical protein